jgi:hypothetical protein
LVHINPTLSLAPDVSKENPPRQKPRFTASNYLIQSVTSCDATAEN